MVDEPGVVLHLAAWQQKHGDWGAGCRAQDAACPGGERTAAGTSSANGFDHRRRARPAGHHQTLRPIRSAYVEAKNGLRMHEPSCGRETGRHDA